MNGPDPTMLCGCCEGADARTPLEIFNRPGLPALVYRAGTYATFLETMLARLGQVTILPGPGDPQPPQPPLSSGEPAALRPLAGLRTRAPGDPAIALLDAWAVVADVLTFYNERIANEGYLRTAIERRSLVELARLVGYTPRPGVSATAYLAFTLDSASPPVSIPAETKVQSSPEQGQSGQNELPQIFETAEPVEARPAWNAIRLRLSQPQYILRDALRTDTAVYVKSPSPALKQNDPLLLEFTLPRSPAERALYRVLDAQALPVSPEAGAPAEKTRLFLDDWNAFALSEAITRPNLVYWNTALYYASQFSPYQTSSAARQAAAILGREGIAALVITAVERDVSVTIAADNLPADMMFELEMRTAGDGASEWVFVTRFHSGASGDTISTFEIPDAVKGSAEIEVRLAVPSSFENGGETFISTVFGNETGSLLVQREHNESGIIGAIAARLSAVRAGLDARFNRFAGWIEAALTELGMIQRAYEIEAEAPDKTGDEFPTYSEADVLGYLKAVQETTALTGELDRAPRLKPVLEPLLAKRIQSYQMHLARSAAPVSARLAQSRKSSFQSVLNAVRAAPADQPAGQRQLARSTQALYNAASDLGPRMLTRLSTRAGQLYDAWATGAVPRVYARPDSPVLNKAYVMRVKAGLFGQQIAGKANFTAVPVTGGSPITQISSYAPFLFSEVWPDLSGNSTSTIYLDREYDKILPGSWIVIESPGRSEPFQVVAVKTQTVSAFGVSAAVTVLTLDGTWVFHFPDSTPADDALVQRKLLYGTRVYAQSELVELVDEPVTLDITGEMVELDGLYEGLHSGKWVIVEGERTDLPGAARVKGAELVMIANVLQDVQMVDEDTPLPGDRPHTFLQLARSGLNYRYRRGTVKVYANVVKATHGETHTQVLGGGDASKPFQTFELLFKPLTYLPAPTAVGVEAALQLRVNNILWHEAPNLAALSPTNREYLVKIDDDGKTWVIFGDGVHGARLPTAPENVRARYRSGMGKAGNVRGGGINLLLSRPPGVKEAVNPLPASGGADREGPSGIRRSAPLALKALDRLVSVQDYEDFCRIYAGIGKSRAVELPAAGGFLVHITIAGDEDIPIDPAGDLYRNLVAALRKLGDPHQPFRIAQRERILPVISAGVRLQPDYAWEFVEPQVRAALLQLLSFENRELGEDITSSEVIAAIQSVPGVYYTDLDILDRVDQARLESFLRLQGEQKGEETLDLPASLDLKLHSRIPAALARPDKANPLSILPAQIAYLDPEISDLLILKEMAL